MSDAIPAMTFPPPAVAAPVVAPPAPVDHIANTNDVAALITELEPDIIAANIAGVRTGTATTIAKVRGIVETKYDADAFNDLSKADLKALLSHAFGLPSTKAGDWLGPMSALETFGDGLVNILTLDPEDADVAKAAAAKRGQSIASAMHLCFVIQQALNPGAALTESLRHVLPNLRIGLATATYATAGGRVRKTDIPNDGDTTMTTPLQGCIDFFVKLAAHMYAIAKGDDDRAARAAEKCGDDAFVAETPAELNKKVKDALMDAVSRSLVAGNDFAEFQLNFGRGRTSMPLQWTEQPDPANDPTAHMFPRLMWRALCSFHPASVQNKLPPGFVIPYFSIADIMERHIPDAVRAVADFSTEPAAGPVLIVSLLVGNQHVQNALLLAKTTPEIGGTTTDVRLAHPHGGRDKLAAEVEVVLGPLEKAIADLDAARAAVAEVSDMDDAEFGAEKAHRAAALVAATAAEAAASVAYDNVMDRARFMANANLHPPPGIFTDGKDGKARAGRASAAGEDEDADASGGSDADDDEEGGGGGAGAPAAVAAAAGGDDDGRQIEFIGMSPIWNPLHKKADGTPVLVLAFEGTNIRRIVASKEFNPTGKTPVAAHVLSTSRTACWLEDDEEVGNAMSFHLGPALGFASEYSGIGDTKRAPLPTMVPVWALSAAIHAGLTVANLPTADTYGFLPEGGDDDEEDEGADLLPENAHTDGVDPALAVRVSYAGVIITATLRMALARMSDADPPPIDSIVQLVDMAKQLGVAVTAAPAPAGGAGAGAVAGAGPPVPKTVLALCNELEALSNDLPKALLEKLADLRAEAANEGYMALVNLIAAAAVNRPGDHVLSPALLPSSILMPAQAVTRPCSVEVSTRCMPCLLFSTPTLPGIGGGGLGVGSAAVGMLASCASRFTHKNQGDYATGHTFGLLGTTRLIANAKSSQVHSVADLMKKNNAGSPAVAWSAHTIITEEEAAAIGWKAYNKVPKYLREVELSEWPCVDWTHSYSGASLSVGSGTMLSNKSDLMYKTDVTCVPGKDTCAQNLWALAIPMARFVSALMLFRTPVDLRQQVLGERFHPKRSDAKGHTMPLAEVHSRHAGSPAQPRLSQTMVDPVLPLMASGQTLSFAFCVLEPFLHTNPTATNRKLWDAYINSCAGGNEEEEDDDEDDDEGEVVRRRRKGKGKASAVPRRRKSGKSSSAASKAALAKAEKLAEQAVAAVAAAEKKADQKVEEIEKKADQKVEEIEKEMQDRLAEIEAKMAAEMQAKLQEQMAQLQAMVVANARHDGVAMVPVREDARGGVMEHDEDGEEAPVVTTEPEDEDEDEDEPEKAPTSAFLAAAAQVGGLGAPQPPAAKPAAVSKPTAATVDDANKDQSTRVVMKWKKKKNKKKSTASVFQHDVQPEPVAAPVSPVAPLVEPEHVDDEEEPAAAAVVSPLRSLSSRARKKRITYDPAKPDTISGAANVVDDDEEEDDGNKEPTSTVRCSATNKDGKACRNMGPADDVMGKYYCHILAHRKQAKNTKITKDKGTKRRR